MAGDGETVAMAGDGARRAFYEPQLDGLRGLMAAWVFVYHTASLSGYFTRFIPAGAIAVDVFMFLSGLLMTRNFAARETKEPLASWCTVRNFWVRRFFRIAPLYYIAVAISLYVVSQYHPQLVNLASTFPPSWAGQVGNDPSQYGLTAGNVISHLSFAFGLFPRFVSNNILPDWSLSLEMQFYLVLPFVLILARRSGFTLIAISSTIIMLITARYIGLYLTPGPLGLWPQPALLAFKTNCFLTGVLLGVYHERRDLTISTLFFISAFVKQNPLFTIFALLCFIMLYPEPETTLGRIGIIAKNIFSCRIARFFGDISYSVYLLHALILFPVFWLLTRKMPHYLELRSSLRWLILLGCSAIILVPLAYGVYRTVELPGIALGRRLTRQKRHLIQSFVS